MKKPLSAVTRRSLLQCGIAATAAALIDSPLLASNPDKSPRHNRIHQSVSRWCYKDIPLDHLCTSAAGMGLKGIDLLEISEFDIPARYGLVCTMGYAGGGEINHALNRLENHVAIEAAFRKNIPSPRRQASRTSSPSPACAQETTAASPTKKARATASPA
jgi:hydroxypyruvate isomerase